MGKTIDIGGRIHNPEVGNVVTGANEILDDTKNKKQDVINSEVDAALEALDANKQDNLTFDQTPTESSTNPVTSGGVYAADLALQQAIEAILTLIPSAASALNQLADKSFVNSSIATASATFRGTYNLVSDLHLSVTASHQDIATALASAVSTADNNDYCFVQIPTSDTSSDIRVTERYKFNGTAWAYEYDLNNSGFTAQQWEAINSGITALLVQKLGALPTADELATSLAGKQNVLTFDNVPTSGSDNPVKSGGLYQLFAAIDAKMPSDASANNKLVAENRLAAYVTAIIEALDASFDVTSTDGHVTFRITQTNGQIASVQILTSDIASDTALIALGGRVSTNETDIANLQAAYAGLTQSDVIVVNGALPSSGQQQNKIYRQPDPDHTPPQFYSDYMWNGSTWVLMATYNNAIDNVPTYQSNNLVKSGGVFDDDSKATVNNLVRIASLVNTTTSNVYITDGVMTIKQSASGNQAVNTGIIPNPRSMYTIEIVAKCDHDTQVLTVGEFSSNENLQTNKITLRPEVQRFVIRGNVNLRNSPVVFGILAANVKIGNDITIYSAVIYQDSKDVPLEENIFLFPVVGKYIDTTGTINNAINAYRIAKTYLKTGYYNIVGRGPGSGVTLCRYTNSAYNVLDEIVIGTSSQTSLNTSIYLTEGYYCFSWNWSQATEEVKKDEFIVHYGHASNKYGDNKVTPISESMGLRILNGDILQVAATFNTTAVQGDGVITMHQDSASLNMAVTLPIVPVVGGKYNLRFKAKCASGTQRIFVGEFSSPAEPTSSKAEINLTTTEKEYNVTLVGADNVGISFGIFTADAHQGVDVIITSCYYTRLGSPQTEEKNIPITFNTDGFLQSVNKRDKYLVKIACAGDSLVANAVGGSIPAGLDEGATMRPIRMDYNNIPRRLYDYMSWNKPTWRRLDNADWTKSGFTSFNVDVNGVPFLYHKATTQGAYVEIVVPQGYEHFALVARTKGGHGKLNVTINGNNPSTITYINPVLSTNPNYTQAQMIEMVQNNSYCDESVCPINIPSGENVIDLNKGTSNFGNYFAVFEYNNLPSGQANTIRFTADSATEVDVWGGFYWSGNTMVIMNIAHGGYDTSMLIEMTLTDELLNADYDAVFFEVTEMNNMRLTLEKTNSDLRTIVSMLNQIGIDRCFTSCNLLGLSVNYDVNFYVESVEHVPSDKTQEQINDVVKSVLNELGQPFVDLFQYFRWHTENRGGTLEGGQAGLWYTWDGQHPNPECCQMWVDALKKVINNTPIMIEA